jgi:subtilisin family serine protease
VAALGLWTASPGAASAAGPSGPCGPAGQPCTWNFSPDAGSTHGADVYAGQALGREGAGVLVAVVDTWVDPNHPDFTGRVVDEADCIGGTCRDHSYVPDSCTHGTHVAGTIASASYGVAPEADILAVQVLDDGGQPGSQCSGSPTDVANGINFAVAHHARVINLSVGELVPGVLQDPGVTAAVQAAAAAGAVVVFAAGNSSSPGVTDNYGSDALLVAATGPDGQIAGYSNSGGVGGARGSWRRRRRGARGRQRVQSERVGLRPVDLPP